MARTEEKADVWMPIYIGDYLADTGRLTTEQHGAYFLLIMDYWRSGPLPDEKIVLQNVTRLSDFLFKKHWPILQKFFELKDGHWHHKRIDEEMAKALTGKASASEKARNAANARWAKDDATSNAQADAPEMLEECPSPSPSSSPVNPTDQTTGSVVVTGASHVVAPGKISADDWAPKDAAEWLRHFRDKHGFEADPTSVNDRKRLWPVFAGWTNAGLSARFVDEAVAVAIRDAREPIVCLPLYVDRCMANASAARAAPRANGNAESRQAFNDRENARAKEMLFGPETDHAA